MVQKTILIKFDGVIHSKKSGWKGIDIIPDSPIDGAIEWLNNLIMSSMHTGLKICIYSYRNKSQKGIKAMKNYLVKYGMNKSTVNCLTFPKKVISTFLTIDDRVIRFNGNFPTIDRIIDFKSYMEQRRKSNHIFDPPMKFDQVVEKVLRLFGDWTVPGNCFFRDIPFITDLIKRTIQESELLWKKSLKEFEDEVNKIVTTATESEEREFKKLITESKEKKEFIPMKYVAENVMSMDHRVIGHKQGDFIKSAKKESKLSDYSDSLNNIKEGEEFNKGLESKEYYVVGDNNIATKVTKRKKKPVIKSVKGLKLNKIFEYDGVKYIVDSFPTRYSVCGRNNFPKQGEPEHCKVPISKIKYL